MNQEKTAHNLWALEYSWSAVQTDQHLDRRDAIFDVVTVSAQSTYVAVYCQQLPNSRWLIALIRTKNK